MTKQRKGKTAAASAQKPAAAASSTQAASQTGGNMPKTSSSQPLPQKELAVFRRIVKCYENKQFKTGLKLCKQILEKKDFAEHGETLSMRGLILNCLGKELEALETVKLGLKRDIGSYVCWHVYGLVLRQHKKYDEALVAYKQALKRDELNQQILRDLCLLQIQVRDFDGYKDTRFKLLSLRPQSISWYGYATALHLLKEYDLAFNIIEEYLKCEPPQFKNDNKQKIEFFSRSELILYQIMILKESGKYQEALEHLEQNSTLVVDKLAYLENRAQILMLLNNKEAASKVYERLITRNPENGFYYQQLEAALGFTEGDTDKRLRLYDSFAERLPMATLPQILPLYFIQDEGFKVRVFNWVLLLLRKGVPSLFKSLVPIYKFPSKVAILENMLKDFASKIDKKGYAKACLSDLDDYRETPTTSMWLYYLIAQHYDKVGKYQLAMEFIDRAITHTPNMIDLYMAKAKILKHQGNLYAAADVMEFAQSFDTADRYLNSKCAKYLLRVSLVDEAEAMCAKFTREGVNASVTLNEMQCMWYAIEQCKAYMAQGKYGDALRKCHQVEAHFISITDDQFDFHTYCLRKTTLTSYIELLRLEDHLRKNSWYYKISKLATKIYLRMHDRPQDIFKQNGLEENMSPEELKKLKRKQKKQQLREEAEKKGQTQKPAPKREEGIEPVGEDIDGEVLLKTEDPLKEAAKFISPVLRYGCDKVSGNILAFDVYHRKKRPLLMIQCLLAAKKVNPDHPHVHLATLKLHQFLAANQQEGTIGLLIGAWAKSFYPKDFDPVKYNDEYIQKHQDVGKAWISYWEGSTLLNPSSASAVKERVMFHLKNVEVNGKPLQSKFKLKDVLKLYELVTIGVLGDWSSDEISELRRACAQIYPHSTALGGGMPAKQYAEKHGQTVPEPEKN